MSQPGFPKPQRQRGRCGRWVGLLFGFLLGWLAVLTIVPLQALSLSDAVAPAATLPLAQAVVLGLVQGATEFLPISSTAHLIGVSLACGWSPPSVAFSAILELGSVVAVFTYFWEDICQLWIGTRKAVQQAKYDTPEFRLVVGIGVGTLPIIAVGLLLKRLIPDFAHSPLRSLGTIALMSIVMALLLALAEWRGQRQRQVQSLRVQDGILIGLAQAAAIIPGVSRSGATLTSVRVK